jgi:hypothetical protein
MLPMITTTTITKNEALTKLQAKLAVDAKWAQRALLAIFKNQTEDEKTDSSVKYHNGMGFRAVDSYILTSFANQLQTRGFLTPKQMVIVLRKMPVYARQLMKFHGEKIQASLAH